MKISIDHDKRKYAVFAAVFFLLAAAWILIRFPIWAGILFMAVFGLLLMCKLQLHEGLPWLWTILLFAGGSVLSTYSVQYLLLEPDELVYLTNYKWILNILCVLTGYLIALFFTNHAGISSIIAQIGWLLVGFADYFVYMFRHNEITFADLQSVGTGLSVAENYQFEFSQRCVYVIFWCILYVILAGKCGVRFAQAIHMRVISGLLVILCMVAVAMNLNGMNTETWEMKGTYRNGFVLNFVLSIRDSVVSEPEGYSADAIQDMEELYQEDGSLYNDVNVENPTIIAIMNESFADLSVIAEEEELDTNMPLTPYFDSLKENTIKGYALASVFGAKTPNSEWEFQTGNSMAFLPGGSVAYQQYLDARPASLVSTLKDNGYTCVAMHPYYATGWSRDKVYPKLGYDEMYFLDDFDQTKLIRKYISDEELYTRIIDRYEKKEADEKLYLFGVTMQNHGRYTETYENFPEEYYKTGRSYTDVNQYLSLIHESDDALRKLVDYFKDVEEPVEIIFFGDHQPSLNYKFYQMMNGRGLSGLTEAQLEALYQVPFFIWTNYESQEKEVPITSLNYLSTMALQRAGIPLPAYNQFLADMMEAVPAINARGYFSIEENDYIHVEDAKGVEADWIARYRILQYNSMFDKKDRSSLFFPYFK